MVLLSSACWPTATLGPTSKLFVMSSVPPVVLLRSALNPMAVLPLVVLFSSAPTPTAVFESPSVLTKSAAAPMAVFESALLNSSVAAPTAVLKPPVVTFSSENAPAAVLAEPVVRLRRAFSPSAVVKLGYPPSGAGTTPKAFGAPQRPKTAAAMSMLIRFIEFSSRGFFIFLSSLVIFDLLVLWVFFGCAQGRSEPSLRVVENAGCPYES